MWKAFRAHIGSMSGESIIIFASSVTEDYSSSTKHLLPWYEENIPTVYSSFYTYIAATSGQLDNALLFGLPESRILTPYLNDSAVDLYFADNKFIQLKTSGQFSFWINGVEGTTIGPGSVAGPIAIPYAADDTTYYYCYFGSFGGDAIPGGRTARYNVTAISASWNIADFWEDIEPLAEDTDPYAPAGESEPNPGDGDFDFSSTDIPQAGVPTIGAMDTGFCSLFNPSATNLKSLANYMWSSSFDLASLKKLFADPMDCILGLHIIPTISGHPATSSSVLTVGNISTGLSMPAVTEQYYQLDCGTIQIPAKWGAYLDYSPYTRLSLYLPYVGYVDISPDDCMRGSINVKYTVDVLSGTCTAQVYCVSNRGQDGHTLYTFNGSCACECPITAGQYKAGFQGVLEAAGGIGQMLAGNVLGGLGQTAAAIQSMIKPEVKRSGGFGGSAGLMAIQYPYLILTVPHMCIPGRQNTYIGYPSFVTKVLGELTGYTQIEVTHLNNMTCSDEEAADIISLLKEGVIM